MGSSRNHVLAPAEFGLLPTLVGGGGVSDERYPLGIFEWLDLAGALGAAAPFDEVAVDSSAGALDAAPPSSM